MHPSAVRLWLKSVLRYWLIIIAILFFGFSVMTKTKTWAAPASASPNQTIPFPRVYLPIIDAPPATATETPTETPTPLPTQTSEPTITPTPTATRITAKLWEGRYESDQDAASWELLRVTDNGDTISFAGVVLYNGSGCDVLSYTFDGSQPIIDGKFRFTAGGNGSPEVSLSCTVTSEQSVDCETNYAVAQLGGCGIGSSRADWRGY